MRKQSRAAAGASAGYIQEEGAEIPLAVSSDILGKRGKSPNLVQTLPVQNLIFKVSFSFIISDSLISKKIMFLWSFNYDWHLITC